MSDHNVTVFYLNIEACGKACAETLSAFSDRGIRINPVHATSSILKELIAEGFTDLPVVKLAREGESWQGHQPDRIESYVPAASELSWKLRRVGSPSRAWLR